MKQRSNNYWLYGTHAVAAALANPERRMRRIAVLRGSGAVLEGLWERARHPAVEEVDARFFSQVLSNDAVHQGVAVEVEMLSEPGLDDLLASGVRGPVLLLDQVTDPHNVGAILRSAVAFEALAVVVTRHHAPSENGTLAKAASGALELVPLIPVTNLTQAMETLKQAGYWVAGLDGEATQALHQSKLDYNTTALVLGAEGKGLRRLTGERCDLLVKLPMGPHMESLNVSNAAAVALYELYRAKNI